MYMKLMTHEEIDVTQIVLLLLHFLKLLWFIFIPCLFVYIKVKLFSGKPQVNISGDALALWNVGETNPWRWRDAMWGQFSKVQLQVMGFQALLQSYRQYNLKSSQVWSLIKIRDLLDLSGDCKWLLIVERHRKITGQSKWIRFISSTGLRKIIKKNCLTFLLLRY